MLVISLSSVAAFAGELGYGLGSYLSYESNIDRTETFPRKELIAAIYGALSYRETAGFLTGRLDTNVERRYFTRKTYNDDTRAFLSATGTWTIIPRRLIWIGEDTFQDALLNLTSAGTPGNQAKSNSLSTGPELIVPLGSANSMVAGARYGRFDIENSASDNKRYRGYGRLVHSTPSQSTIALNYETSRVFFEPGNPFQEVRQESVFASYETPPAAQGTHAGDSAAVDVGKSRVTQYADDFRNTLSGRFVRLKLGKAISRQLTVSAGYSNQISDTYSDAIAGIAGAQVPSEGGVFIVQGGGLATGDFYHSKRGELGVTARGGDIEYTLQTYSRVLDFLTLDQDYRETGGTVLLAWTISGAARFQAFAGSSTRKYESLERRDEDLSYGMGLDFKLNRTLTLGLSAGQIRRRSSAAGASYVDQRAMVLLGYGANQQVRSIITR